MLKNKYVNFILITICIVAAIFLLPFLLKLFLPFVLGFLIATMCQKIIRFFESRFKINREISSAMLVIFIVGVITLFLSLVIFQLFIQIGGLFSSFPEFLEMLRLKGTEFYLKFSDMYANLPTEVQDYTSEFFTELQVKIKDAVAPIVKNIITFAKNFVFSLPEVVIFIIMFILSTFFFTKDYQLVVNFTKELFSKSILSKATMLKDTVFGAFFKYVKAQLIMMSIIGTEVTIALWILGIDYPLVWGIIIGFTDALPFFGTAIIIVPWAIITAIYGDYTLAIALIILQCMTFITRQLLEPRIVSSQIGLHPILTLISIYIGLKLFGVIGMIITPIVMLLIVNFYVSVKENAPVNNSQAENAEEANRLDKSENSEVTTED